MLTALLCAGLALPDLVAQPVAFPGAEGFGRFASGGRGGDVYAVTTLNDAGPGSLREAVSVGNRTVVFRVSGTIDLQSDLLITQSNLTIAGQTAPGDGICLRRHPLRLSGASNVILRHLRVRPGADSGRTVDGIEVRTGRNILLDHCSISWSIDEAVNTWHGAKDITVQWCLVAEPLHRSIHPKGPHGYGASWGGENTSYHHNLFAHCTARNPSVAGQAKDHTVHMDHRCSVIFNWEHRSSDGKPDSINVVNNYYKPGPATLPAVARRIVRIDDTRAAYGFDSFWYIEGNVVEGFPRISADNWAGGVDFEGGTSERVNRRREPFPFAPVTTQPATEAYRLVLAGVGATLPRRDAVDRRIVREVETGQVTFAKGIIDTPAQVGGWPELQSAPASADSDADGMPDTWEQSRGLDPRNPADRNGTSLAPPYTNLEVYLNSLVPQ
ncbi:MAG: pectate lyase [Verrucomicrobia bacterium]|nr:pectate lyase [Verrucomicrobiota bacterium]